MSTPAQPSSPTLRRWTRSEFETHLRPRLQAFIAAHAKDLDGVSVDETQAVNDLYDLVHGESQLDWTVPVRGTRADLPTPCAIAVVGVAISSVALVLQAAGMPPAVSRALATRLIDTVISESPAILTTLEADVAAITGVGELGDQASAVLTLVASACDVAPVGDVAATMTSELSSYHRLVAAVIVDTQLDLWFATQERSAAIAELLLFATAIEGLAISAAQAYEICHPGTYPPQDPVVSRDRPATKGRGRP